MYRNHEHYPDPTAGAALAAIRKEEHRMNTGKRFEADWKASVPRDVWYYRFRDSPISYYGGSSAEGIRFAQDNLCDCQLYRRPRLYLIELKTVATPSAALTTLFGRFDPETRRYKKQKHLEDMEAAACHPGITALVVINYRAGGHTYALPARQALGFVNAAINLGGRKSIPESFCAEYGLPVEGRKLRVNWRYDVAGLLDRLEETERGHDAG